MTTNEKLSMLREKMAEAGVQAYLIPSSDPHISEYLPITGGPGPGFRASTALPEP